MEKKERVYDADIIRNCKEGFNPNYAFKCSIGTYCAISDKYRCQYQKDDGKHLKKCEKW